MSFVQKNQVDSGSTTSATLAYSGAVTAGNLLLAIIRYSSTANNLTSVSDNVNVGNWTVLTTQVESTGGETLYIAYKANTLGGTPTVTAAFSAAATVRWIIAEYGNIVSSNVVDSSLSQDNTTVTTSPSTPQITTATQNVTLVTALCSTNNTTGLTVTDNLFTSRAQVVGFSSNIVVTLSDSDVTATGSYSETYTLNVADATATAIVAFKSPGGGGGSTSQQAAGQSIIRLQAPPWR